MSKKIVAEMKNIYDVALAMTALANKEFGNTYTNFYKMRRVIEDKLSKKRKQDTDDKENEDLSESDGNEGSDVKKYEEEESSASK